VTKKKFNAAFRNWLLASSTSVEDKENLLLRWSDPKKNK
jgi:hypothetical protein